MGQTCLRSSSMNWLMIVLYVYRQVCYTVSLWRIGSTNWRYHHLMTWKCVLASNAAKLIWNLVTAARKNELIIPRTRQFMQRCFRWHALQTCPPLREQPQYPEMESWTVGPADKYYLGDQIQELSFYMEQADERKPGCMRLSLESTWMQGS